MKKHKTIESDRLGAKMYKILRKTGFTIVETMIIVAIVVVLMAMAIPIYQLLTM